MKTFAVKFNPQTVRFPVKTVICILALLSFAVNDLAAASGAAGIAVLDTYSPWRMHATLEPIELASGAKVELPAAWMNYRTPPPGEGWMEPDFDDGFWHRGPLTLVGRTPLFSRLCLRGRFYVTAPNSVSGLSLSVEYRGGIIVYLNGRELHRENLAPGASLAGGEGGVDRTLTALNVPSGLLRQGVNVLAIEAVRARYPLGEPDGENQYPVHTCGIAGARLTARSGTGLVPNAVRPHGFQVWNADTMAEDFDLDFGCSAEPLRPVVIHAARNGMFSGKVIAGADKPIRGLRVTPGDLSASPVFHPETRTWTGKSGITLEAALVRFGEDMESVVLRRPDGSPIHTKLYHLSSADQQYVKEVAAGDIGTIPAGGVITADNIRVRYGIEYPFGELSLARTDTPMPYPSWPTLLGGLAEAPLDEFGMTRFSPREAEHGTVYRSSREGWYDRVHGISIRAAGSDGYRSWNRSLGNNPERHPALPEYLEPVAGAVVPIWFSVKVPRDAPAGVYSGEAIIETDGNEPVTVRIETVVEDFVLPDRGDYRSFVDIIQNPDTLALEYDLPLWSDRHFELIGKSLRLIGETGCRIVYIPLIAGTNLGNEESMVRWIRRGSGYEHDFSVMERYLDLVERNMGKPKHVVLVVWDLYMMPKTSNLDFGRSDWRIKTMINNLDRVGGEHGSGPRVTVSGPDGGGAETVTLPLLETGESAGLWKPLFDELLLRFQRRGLDDALMLGICSDAWPTEEQTRFFHELSGGVPWVIQSHDAGPRDGMLYNLAPVGYGSKVWGISFGADESLRGWASDDLILQFDRFDKSSYRISRWRHMTEISITADTRGISRIGGDYWRVLKNRRGLRVGRSHERYPDSHWRNLTILDSVLAPGPQGPMATMHLEAFREGAQESEARIVIEKALSDPVLRAKLGDALVERCEKYLHRRHMKMWISLSNLQFYRRPHDPRTATMAEAWRLYGKSNIEGHNWFLGSGRQKRTAELFRLAGEVQRAVK